MDPNIIDRLAELGSDPEQRRREDEAIIALSKLTAEEAKDIIEQVDARVGGDWLMDLLLRRALDTVEADQ